MVELTVQMTVQIILQKHVEGVMMPSTSILQVTEQACRTQRISMNDKKFLCSILNSAKCQIQVSSLFYCVLFHTTLSFSCGNAKERSPCSPFNHEMNMNSQTDRKISVPRGLYMRNDT